MSVLHIERFSAPPVNYNEIMRYCGDSANKSAPLAKSIMESLSDELCYKACYRTADIMHLPDGSLDFGFFKSRSRDLKKNLQTAEKAVVFAATVGIGIERAINKYSVLSPASALVADAIGTERIEALSDSVCLRLKAIYGNLRPRFSPGYGDLPLTLQREIFAFLDCPKSIGLSLNESLMMSPQKSVTAIVGILPPESGALCKINNNALKCKGCEFSSCVYRKSTQKTQI